MSFEKPYEKYLDWCWLNKDGMKVFGKVFPDRCIPIVSMISIVFKHPKLENPQRAYLLKGKDLTEEQIVKLIDIISKNFEEPNEDKIRKEILNNRVPIRESITSGSGTKRPYMYME